MVNIKKIFNGYIVSFANTDNKEVNIFFPSLDKIYEWLKEQFEPSGKVG